VTRLRPFARSSVWPAVALLAAGLAGCARPTDPAATGSNHCSLRFDGDDDFVSLGTIGPGHPLLLAGSPFTLSAWFRQEPGGDSYQRIIDKSEEALAQNGWALAADPGERRIHFYVSSGRRAADFITSSKAYRLGSWHHVAAVARSGSLEIWVDGVRDRRASYESGGFTLPAAAATPARLGSWNHAGGRKWRGWLDEVAVWNVDLPSEAIRAIFAAGRAADLRRDGGDYRQSARVAGWWRMEEGAGNAPPDRLVDSAPAGTAGTPGPDPATGNAPRFDCAETP
jgi:hypothetical protein